MFMCEMREKICEFINLFEFFILEDLDIFGLVLDYFYIGVIILNIFNVEDVLKIIDFFLLDDVKDFCR